MKMKAAIVGDWVLILFAIIGIFSAIALVTYLAARTLAPLCWQNTIEPLASSLTGEKGAIGDLRLLGGRSEFDFRLPMEYDCVKSVQFKGYKACMGICDSFGGEQDKKICKERCTKCKDRDGCVVAVPVKKSFGNVVWSFVSGGDAGKTAKQIHINIDTFPSDYSFEGDDELQPLKGKDKVYCLHFSKSGDSYNIVKKVVDVTASCGGFTAE
ncbi:MAG: hypothetical protein HYX24_01475 [Candidatus Aenigmarchaeota archaeon]|nr:hypothetical protein [Candidatus Aenigmarchaeota archaeon]